MVPSRIQTKAKGNPLRVGKVKFSANVKLFIPHCHVFWGPDSSDYRQRKGSCSLGRLKEAS